MSADPKKEPEAYLREQAEKMDPENRRKLLDCVDQIERAGSIVQIALESYGKVFEGAENPPDAATGGSR